MSASLMSNPEVFYLHIQGEQLGPYTIPQVDHLLNSGLIAEETLYWREGLDQWQPVTSLVPRRKRTNPWVKPLLVIGIVSVLALLAQIFGSMVLLGWREANQHTYTAEAAYWRARSIVRSSGVAPRALIEFQDFAAAMVELQQPRSATVLLRGELTEPDGQTRRTAWSVAMSFDEKRGEWTGAPAREVALEP